MKELTGSDNKCGAFDVLKSKNGIQIRDVEDNKEKFKVVQLDSNTNVLFYDFFIAILVSVTNAGCKHIISTKCKKKGVTGI